MRPHETDQRGTQPHNAHEPSRGAREAAQEAIRILAGRPLIVVSNREPYEHHTDDDGEIVASKTMGGVTVALDPIMQAVSGTWIAWGSGEADRKVVDDKDGIALPPGEERYRLRRVWMTDEEVAQFYGGHVNQTLWPLCHAQTERVRFRRSEWDAYQRINRRFASAAIDELARTQAKEGVIWFQDYHFATAPAMVRDALPGSRILQFWHIPWPPWEIFRQHPQRRGLLEGMLGCDVIGMHIDLFCQNFLDCVQRELGLPVSFPLRQIIFGDRTIRVRASPISVDAEELQHLASSSRSGRMARSFRSIHRLEGKRIGIGVERSDYTKGIIERLHALEHLFEQYPEWRGKFTFIQVSPPSRETLPAYRSFQQHVSQEVQRINARFRKASWQPIIFIRKKQPHERLAALYRIADVAIVSSLQDGMNLVAKEFLAAQVGEEGVLVLSEFAGASDEMPDALLINPYDVEGFAHAIHTALTMPRADRTERMRRMRQHLFSHTIYDWMADFIGELDRIGGAENGDGSPSPLLDHLDALRDRIAGTAHIALFCDYDGVLAPIAASLFDARIDDSTRDLLVKLRDSATVRVSIISGRSVSDLSALVHVERLTYAGNHGLEIANPAFHRVHPGASHLRTLLQRIYDDLRKALQPYAGVIVEDKHLTLTVHYRLANPAEIPDILDTCRRVVYRPQRSGVLRITTGKRVFEVRPNIDWDKGKAVLWILQSLYGAHWKKDVLPIYLGDDETDEDAFHALQGGGIGVRVGPGETTETYASFFLEHTDDVPLFLDWLCRAATSFANDCGAASEAAHAPV